MVYHNLPEAGFLRLHQIIGTRRRGIPPIIPVSKTTWYEGIKAGRFPRPVKNGRMTLWRVDDIRNLLEEMSCAVPLLTR